MRATSLHLTTTDNILTETIMKLAIIMPALDEEAAIGPVLDEIPRNIAETQIIVVDNGSTDRTAEVARSHGATVVREDQRGYGSACLAGIRAADSPDILVILDADGADDPQGLSRIVGPILANEADLVMGARSRSRAEASALPPQVHYGNALTTTLIKIVTGRKFEDMGPFRAIRKTSYDSLKMRDENYGWNVEMQIKAIRYGLRVIEVPVPYRKRVGQSKISGTVKGTIAAGSKMIYSVMRYGWKD